MMRSVGEMVGLVAVVDMVRSGVRGGGMSRGIELGFKEGGEGRGRFGYINGRQSSCEFS